MAVRLNLPRDNDHCLNFRVPAGEAFSSTTLVFTPTNYTSQQIVSISGQDQDVVSEQLSIVLEEQISTPTNVSLEVIDDDVQQFWSIEVQSDWLKATMQILVFNCIQPGDVESLQALQIRQPLGLLALFYYASKL